MKHLNKHLIFLLVAALLFGTALTACGGEDPFGATPDSLGLDPATSVAGGGDDPSSQPSCCDSLS